MDQDQFDVADLLLAHGNCQRRSTTMRVWSWIVGALGVVWVLYALVVAAEALPEVGGTTSASDVAGAALVVLVGGVAGGVGWWLLQRRADWWAEQAAVLAAELRD
jgi:hypothetical protein